MELEPIKIALWLDAPESEEALLECKRVSDTKTGFIFK